MAIERINVDPQGNQATGGSNGSLYPVYSPDGTKVAYVSTATNLVSGDTNGQADIFVRDLTTNTTTRVSTTASGGEATGGGASTTLGPVFSPDGTKIAFASSATNLVSGDTNGQQDLFVKDLSSGAIVRVNTAADGIQATGGTAIVNGFSFSPDGTKIVFASSATNLVPGDTNSGGDVFVKTIASGAITRVSTNASGQQTGGSGTIASNPQFSPDGTRVAFQTDAQMVSSDTNSFGDIYVKNLNSGAVERVSVNQDGSQATSGATAFRFSPTGNKIAFTTSASLISGDNNGNLDIYIKDLGTGVLTRASTSATGVEGNGNSSGISLSFSADGTKLAFSSAATNFVSGDNNGQPDIFVKNLNTGAITRVSVQADGSEGSGGTSAQPSLSPDGSKVVFTSGATNLVASDTNGQQDIYRADTTCYVQGTLIRTVTGDVAVEALQVGDLAVTASGEARPIRWIGHRTMACQGRIDVMPVRIAKKAFGDGRPARDLLVSPAHAIAVDVLGEVLIPARRLINGTTITQVDVGEVSYWHVELDSHDILLAEGLPAESYLDCGNRRFFANADATDLMAAPDARPEGPLPFCCPFHEAGPLVDLIRARLEDRAVALGWRKVQEAFGRLHVVADARTIHPDTDGLTARFVVPADARDVRLVSETSVPAHVVPGSLDNRRIGVALAALSIDDGLTGARTIALDDARLRDGFHAVHDGARRMDGSAVLPSVLWDGCKGSFFLRVTLAGPALPRWIAPGETGGVVDLADRRHA